MSGRTDCSSNRRNIVGIAAPAVAKDIVWARDGDIDSLDPHRATSTLSRQVWYQIYDSLLEFNDAGEPIPNLAKRWKVSEDGKEVTFVLADGINCHDGTAFNADDVMWTANRALDDDNPSLTKASWGPVTWVDKIDDLTVSFKFSEPFGAFVPFMADQFTSMLCDSNAEHDDFGVSSAIGTGPWKFASWTKGFRDRPRKKSGLRQSRPPGRQSRRALSPIGSIIRTMPEAQTRVAGSRTGELQVIVPPIQEVKSLQDDREVEVHRRQGHRPEYVPAIRRATVPPSTMQRARQAVSYAIDKDLAIKIVFGDLVEAAVLPGFARRFWQRSGILRASTTRITIPRRPKHCWRNSATARTSRWK